MVTESPLGGSENSSAVDEGKAEVGDFEKARNAIRGVSACNH